MSNKTENQVHGVEAVRPVAYQRPLTVRKRLGVSSSTLWRWIREGVFPKPVRLGAKCVAWRSDVIDQWLESRPQFDQVEA